MRLVAIFEAHGPNRYVTAQKTSSLSNENYFEMSSYASLMRITASPIAPASSFEIADAADAALLDVRREISIFMASIVRRRNRTVA